MNRISLLYVLIIFTITGCSSTPTKFDHSPKLNSGSSYIEVMSNFFQYAADNGGLPNSFEYNIPFYEYANREGNAYSNEVARITEVSRQTCKHFDGAFKVIRTGDFLTKESLCTTNFERNRISMRLRRSGSISIDLADNEKIKKEEESFAIRKKVEWIKLSQCFSKNMVVNDTSNFGLIVKIEDSEALAMDLKTEELKWHVRYLFSPISKKDAERVARRDPSCMRE